VYGRLSDIWSRKNILLVGFGIFVLGSLASSLATNVVQLIAFRAITGVGGGGLMTIAQAIVSDVVSLRERGKYQGIFVGILSVGGEFH
jgi:MFS family permease